MLNHIEEEIYKLKMQDINHEEDIRLWKGKSDVYQPAFSTKHTWHLVRTVAVKKQWYGVVWFPLVTPKYSIHIWLTVRNRLATCDRLLKWYAQVDTACVLYNHSMETRNHLVFECSYSKEIWRDLAGRIMGVRYTNNWDSLILLLAAGDWYKITFFIFRYLL